MLKSRNHQKGACDYILVKVYVTTNGCPGARLASAHLRDFFRVNKCTIVDESRQSDLVIFYACGLTRSRECDSIDVIKKLKSEIRSEARLIVWGCLAKIDPSLLAKFYEGPIVGPMDLNFFEHTLEQIEFPIGEVSANLLLNPKIATSDRRAIDSLKGFVQFFCSAPLWYKKDRNVGNNIKRGETYYIYTSSGCAQNCTYCTEKLALGRVQSKPIENIISEFRRGLREGYGRFCLLSWDLGAYGADINSNLYDLLSKLVRIDDTRNYKIILPQINPLYLRTTYSTLGEIFGSGKIDEMGCQVESGSNRILELMGRKYSVEEWMRYMLKIRGGFPEISLTTHLMVGFPSETDEDFKATLRILDKIFLDDIIVFKYSRRQPTASSYMLEQIPEKIKEYRYRRLSFKAILNTSITKAQRLLALR
jgi:MiaB/RimO family radical SAM methylthiotransferase